MKKGFTLVELLAVIIILALISSITMVVVTGNIEKSKVSLTNTQKKSIEQAAEAYYIKEGDDSIVCIDLVTLKEKGYLTKKDVKDLTTQNSMNGSVKIEINQNQYNYIYQDISCE